MKKAAEDDLDGSYTFFSGDETVAYTQKLTNGELRNKLY